MAGRTRAGMQVLGLTRFSYPAEGGFQTEHADLATREAFLYAPARMDERLRIFEVFTLATLRAQSDDDFTLLVVIGDSMPPGPRARLLALVADMPQVIVRALPSGRHRRVMEQVINEARDDRPCIQFRMDDDDGLGRDFVRETRQIAAEIRPLIDRNRLTAIDFTRGHIAQPTAAGILAEPCARTYWVPSLAVVARPREPLTVMNFNHVKLWQFMPTVTLHEPDRFVRGISDWNDSGIRSGPQAALLDAAGEARFRVDYGICADHVRRVWHDARAI